MISIIFCTGCISKKRLLSSNDIQSCKIDNSNDKCININIYNIFVVGEIHWRKENAVPFMQLAKYLNQNYAVRKIILEDGFSRAKIINNYINFGDSLSLEFLETYVHSSDLNFYVLLSKYNKKLPKHKKICVYGVDYEAAANLPFIIEYIRTLTPDKAPPESIKNIINYIKTKKKYEYYTHSENEVYLDKIEESLFRNSEIYENYYGTNYPLIIEALKRWNFSKQFHNYDPNRGYDSLMFYNRENYIAENFNDIIKIADDEKLMAIFGLAHIGHNKPLGIKAEKSKTFVYYLKNDTSRITELKIASISLIYNNFLNRKAIKKDFPFELKPLYKTVATTPGTYLVKLNANDSLMKKFTEDKIQYLLLYNK